MHLFPLLAVFGVVAGALTTVAGVGGSLFVVVFLSALYSPDLALAVTAPALLISNAHRLYLFRDCLESRDTRRTALLFAGLAMPAAFLGGLVATQLPGRLLHWMLVGVMVLGVARELRLIRWTAGKGTLIPAAMGTGLLTATVGGGSLLMGPALLATGMPTRVFVAVCAATSISMHLARIPAYALGGWIDQRIILGATVLALALVLGNFVGQWIRKRFSDRFSRTMTYGTLASSAAVVMLTAV